MTHRIPYFFALLTIVGGVFISIIFGVNEGFFKDKIKMGLEQNIKISQMADPAEKTLKMNSEAEKNWRYYQRYHFHSTGIGALSLALLLFLRRLKKAPLKIVQATAYAVSVGGFLYPFVWLFAGIYGPELGREVAKENFAFFGYMGGVFLLGALASLVMSLRYDVE